MITMEDAVKLYEEMTTAQEAENKKAEDERIGNETKKTSKILADLDLAPDVVIGRDAWFRFNGATVHLVVNPGRHSWVGFWVVLDKCLNCKDYTHITSEWNLTIENIGMMLSNPTPRYHECDHLDRQGKLEPIRKKTCGEILLDSLDNYIQEIHRYDE